MNPSSAGTAVRAIFTFKKRLTLVTMLGVAGFCGTSLLRAQMPNRQVGPEPTVGGPTLDALAARQAVQHAELMADLPEPVLNNPIRIELTQDDEAELRVPSVADGKTPLRVGLVKAISPAITIEDGKGFERGTLVSEENEPSIWAVAVTSPKARALRLHFTRFTLPEGAEAYWFNTNGQVDGPYTGAGRTGTGDFWTRSIASETGVVLIRFNGNQRDDVSITLKDVGHVRGRGPLPDEQNHDGWPCSDNAPCVVDANCVSGTPADVAKSSIAKMEWIQGIFINTCTGGLIADTDPNSQIPYFLTANHCLSSDNSSLETFFFYTTDSCNGGCPDSIVTGGSPPAASTIGATVMATGSAGDFTLLQLDQAPPAGTVYLGWNNAPVAFSDGAPLYRISNPNFGPQAYSQHDVDTSRPTCTGWPRGERIYSSDITGATMGGSSGSPVLNADSAIVGQLSGCCGFNCGDECDSGSNATVDGALAFYWDSVAPFLDPVGGCSSDAECDDSDPCTIDTCSSGSCSNTPVTCPVGEECVNGTCQPLVCDNDGTCETGEDCNNCSGDCISGSGAVCGNGICETADGEDCVACPSDCNGKTNGNPSGRFCCGDGDGPNPLNCSDPACSTGGWSCTDQSSAPSCCGDLVCEGIEDGFNCELDCGPPPCGDGTCDASEDECNCPVDCGSPPSAETDCVNGNDDDCDGASDCDDADCAGDPACSCLPVGAACSSDGECCSNKCKGGPGNKTCK